MSIPNRFLTVARFYKVPRSQSFRGEDNPDLSTGSSMLSIICVGFNMFSLMNCPSVAQCSECTKTQEPQSFTH